MAAKRKILVSLGAILLLGAFAALIWFGAPTMNGEKVSFAAADGSTELVGTYYAAEGASYAVLLCEGFSADRQMLRPLANLFVKSGISAMCFDYSGHGGSKGVIGFDNATNGQIPDEIELAIQALIERTGLARDRIILLGHSMGGRAILELFSRPAFDKGVNRIILIAPQINYDQNLQSSFFTGVTDAEIEPWLSYSSAHLGGARAYLFGSTADDIVSPESLLAIYARMGGSVPADFETGVTANDNLTLSITGGVFHSYEIFSARFAAFVSDAVADISVSRYPSGSFIVMYCAWFAILAGLLLLFGGLNASKREAWDEPPRVLSVGAFLRRKLLLWLLALLVMALIACISVALPFGSPVMGIVFMGSIAGYGITMLLFYRKGRFKGTEGKLPRAALKPRAKTWPLAVLVFILTLLYLIFAMRSGLYRVYPLNVRLFWLVFACAIMALGFYVSGCEADMLKRAGATGWQRFAYNLIQYVPLFLMSIVYLIIKSYSGLIGAIQNLILLYACIAMGECVKRLSQNRLWGAVATAFVFQTTMLTATALISVF